MKITTRQHLKLTAKKVNMESAIAQNEEVIAQMNPESLEAMFSKMILEIYKNQLEILDILLMDVETD